MNGNDFSIYYKNLCSGNINVVENLLEELKPQCEICVIINPEHTNFNENIMSNYVTSKDIKKIKKSKNVYDLKCRDTHIGNIIFSTELEPELIESICSLISISLYNEIIYKEQLNLHAKNLFMANVSHEIRTPLNSILGMLAVLMSTELQQEQLECVEIMRQSGYNLMSLINDILDLSKLETGQIKLNLLPTNLSELVNSAYSIGHVMPDISSSDQSSNIKFGIEIGTDVYDTILVDSQRLKQILINLISNSYKFTVSGSVNVSINFIDKKHAKRMGVKSLRVAKAEVKNWLVGDTSIHYSNSASVNGIIPSQLGKWRYIKISVKDTGIGINRDDFSKIFKTFSQIDSTITKKFSGTGLGLALSKKFCNLMGGAIQFVSEFGMGSDFYFVIPICEYKTVQPIIDYSFLEKKKILVVNDTLTDLITIGEYLDSWNIEHIDCETGARASLQYIGKVQFNVCIIDLKDKSFNSRKLIRTIKKSKFPMPIIVVRGSDDIIFPDVDQVISKPFKKEILAKTIVMAITNGNMNFQQQIYKPTKTTSFSTSGSDSSSTESYYGNKDNKILIAEDNSFNRITLEKLLRAIGFTNIECAEDGDVAVRMVATSKNLKEHYDIIFMDISMPRLNGMDASLAIDKLYDHKKIKKYKPKIIAVTANAMTGDKEKYMALGCINGYISKPIDSKNKIIDVLNHL